MSEMTRKGFLGGLAAFAAVGCDRRSAHPDAAPTLRFGIVSDIHHSTFENGKGLQNCLAIEPALRYFDSRKADGILVCGDLSDIGTAGSLRAIGRIWDSVFPGGRRSDGEPIANLMHFGDHDMGAFMHKYGWAVKSCADPDEINHIIPESDPAKLWEECFHEKWAPIQAKSVKGYTFVLAHHPLHTAESRNGDRIPGLAGFLAGLGIDSSKPFFYSQHRHFEAGDTNEVLAKYPNVIAFNGHLHLNCADELSLTQEAFTRISVPSLNYCCTHWGRENSFKQKRPDSLLPQVCCAKSWQGLFATVYADRIVVERRDFLHGLPLGPDWVIPLPSPDGSLAKELRARAAVPPHFAADAVLAQHECVGKNRKGVAVPQVRLSFPVAHADGAAPRAYDYEVAAVSGGKVIGSKLVFSPGCYWADETDTGPVECAFAKSELPPDWRDSVAFAVTPRDSFGNRGPALGR